ncbi:unnamed protein product [Zymoseptoria tritici ST99CH_3D7]|uniref:Uncharacterized protein n=1 Tax=Zymoseptoria tritici (strain ST99CH_3D7) TaxID=1276538 RepID=A0A1X7RTK4_ZYMT9|nr:unnamed protein product [Zymoseptoria tritici ST99CH_3D7]
MAPIRRYLRITKFSVLEVRIYLHKPSDAGWLLSSRDNVLQRIIAEVRPKVLPKLREENENAKGRKGGVRKKKKGGIKDVASQEDFEVAIFLKETATRHSLLTKQKAFNDGKPRLQSTGSKLTGGLNDAANPIHVTDEPTADVRREEEDEDVVELYKIPEVHGKRKAGVEEDGGAEEKADEDEDGLFVSSSDEDFFATQRAKPPSKKRRKRNTEADEDKNEENDEAIPVDEEEQDDKKKLMMDTTYDGFSIYGRILCLIVTRKGKRDKGPQGTGTVGGGSQMMEQWVSTQVAGEMGIEDEEG